MNGRVPFIDIQNVTFMFQSVLYKTHFAYFLQGNYAYLTPAFILLHLTTAFDVGRMVTRFTSQPAPTV